MKVLLQIEGTNLNNLQQSKQSTQQKRNLDIKMNIPHL